MVFSVTSMVLNVVGRYPALLVALSLVALASFGCSKQSKEEAPTKDQILSRANDALAAGQYVKAEKDYREVLRVTPNDAVALRQLGALYLTQGQVIQAYAPLKKAIELQPRRSRASTQIWRGRHGASPVARGATGRATRSSTKNLATKQRCVC